MKKTLLILLITSIGMSCLSQSTSTRSFSFTIQPIAGLVSSKITDILDSPPWYPADWGPYREIEYGLETKFMKSFNKVNIGVGMTLRSQYTPKTAPTFAFKESMFGSVEFGNSDSLENISFITNIGIIRSTVSEKFRFFITLGPKINIGKHHNKLNISLHPYLSYQFSETVEHEGYYTRWGTPYTYTYRAIYRTFSLNFAIVFEFNKLKTKPNNELSL